MLYEYLITFFKFLAGLMTERRIIVLSFCILGIYLLWVVLALVFSFQKHFNTLCTKMYNLIKNQPKITIHDTKLNNYANKVSLGFARGFKNYKNSAVGKPSDYINRSDALEVEISGGILNQGKSLMKFYITLASVLVFLFNVSLHIGSNPIAGTALLECMALPLTLFVLLKLFYYLYTSLKQGMYESDTVLFYDLLELMDETFGTKSAASEQTAVSADSVGALSEQPAPEPEAESAEQNSEEVAEEEAEELESEPAEEKLEPGEEELEPGEEAADESESLDLQVDNASEEPEPEAEEAEELEEEPEEEREEPEEESEEEIEEEDAGQLIEDITSESEGEAEEPTGAKQLKSHGDINKAFENLSKFEVKPEDLDKLDPRVAGEIDDEEEARIAKEQEESYLAQQREPSEEAEDSSLSEGDALEVPFVEKPGEPALSEPPVEEPVQEESAEAEGEEPVSDSEELPEGSNEIPNSAVRKMSREQMIEKYDFFKKKNIDVDKLNGEIPGVQNSLPFINVDSHYVIKDEGTAAPNTSEKIEEERKRREAEEEAAREKLQEELKDAAKKQDTARQRALEKLLGKRSSGIEEDEAEEPSNPEPAEAEEPAKTEEPSKPEPEQVEEQPKPEPEAVKAEPVKVLEPKSAEQIVQEDTEKIAKRVRPRAEQAESARAKGFEIEYTAGTNRAHEASKKLSRSKLASGGVEIELNEPRHSVKKEPVEIKQLKTSEDATSVVSAIKGSTTLSENSEHPSNKKELTRANSGSEGGAMPVSEERIERRVRHAERSNEEAGGGDVIEINIGHGAVGREAEAQNGGAQANAKAQGDGDVKRSAPTEQKRTSKVEIKEVGGKGSKPSPAAEGKKPEQNKPKVEKAAQKKASGRPKKAVEETELEGEEKKTRGRPKKVVFDENMQIKTDKEFDIALSRAEKLMKKSEEGLSPSQSKRIEKELKTLIDAMNKYKEGK